MAMVHTESTNVCNAFAGPPTLQAPPVKPLIFQHRTFCESFQIYEDHFVEEKPTKRIEYDDPGPDISNEVDIQYIHNRWHYYTSKSRDDKGMDYKGYNDKGNKNRVFRRQGTLKQPGGSSCNQRH